MKRRFLFTSKQHILLTLAGCLTLVSVVPIQMAQANNPRIDTEIIQKVKQSPAKMISAIVSFANENHQQSLFKARQELGKEAPASAIAQLAATKRANESQSRALNIIKTAGQAVEKVETLPIANALSITAQYEVLEELAKLPNVKAITPNRTVALPEPKIVSKKKTRSARSLIPEREIEPGIKAIQADRVWKDLGIDGKSITIGIIDQAVDVEHPALLKQFRGYDAKTNKIDRSSNYLDLIGDGQIDSDQHGTHVAGTLVGAEKRDDHGQEITVNKIGVAPGANFIVARAFKQGVGATNENIIKACQWMMAPGGDPSKAPRILNQSWSDGKNEIDPWFEEMAQTLRDAQILSVFSAGNNGGAKAAPGSIDNPGASDKVLAVGAVDFYGKLADFSRRGPSKYPQAKIKPDLTAPGVQIRSALPGGKYASWNGTSQAAPHVAATAALMLQANPKLSVKQIETILKETARQGVDDEYVQTPNQGYGFGIVDAYAAVVRAKKLMGANDLDDPAQPSEKNSKFSIKGKVTQKSEKLKLGNIKVEFPERLYVGRQIPVQVSVPEAEDRQKISKIQLEIKQNGQLVGEGQTEKTISDTIGKGKIYRVEVSGQKEEEQSKKIDRLAAGTALLTVKITLLDGQELSTDETKLTVLDGIKPGQWASDFESFNADIEVTGDYRIAVANYQTDPVPTSGNRFLGLNPGNEGLGGAELSTAQLPRIDLRNVTSKEHPVLRFRETGSWDAAIMQFQALPQPKAEGEKAKTVFSYPTKLNNDTWIDREIDLSPWVGKLIDLFIFNLNKPGITSGQGLYLDDMKLLLSNGDASVTDKFVHGPKTVTELNLVKDANSDETGIEAQIEVLGTGMKTHSNRNGNFELAQLTPGKYRLWVGKDGYETQEIEIDLTQDQTMNIVLKPKKEKDSDQTKTKSSPGKDSEKPRSEEPDETVKFPGMMEISYDRNNPRGGAITHDRVGWATAIDAQGLPGSVLDHVYAYAAGHNPALTDGELELSIKTENQLGRLIDMIKPRSVFLKSGHWNRIDLRKDAIPGDKKIYIVFKQLSPKGTTAAIGLDLSVSPGTRDAKHGHIFNGEFLSLRSRGIYGVPMIRAYYAVKEKEHQASPPVAPVSDQVGLSPIADPIRTEGQKAKDKMVIGDWEISPSRGQILKYRKLQDILALPPNKQILTVPSEIGGIQITSIGAEAFKNPNLGVAQVEKVVIEPGIHAIHESAFAHLGIAQVELPNSLEAIYADAFTNARFTHLSLPPRLVHIGERAFYGANKLIELDIPDSVERIEREAFRNNYNLRSLKLPHNDKFTELSASVFRDAWELKNIIIPASVKHIKNGAFWSAGLQNVTLKPGIKIIDDNAFADNELSSVKLPDSIEQIGSEAFAKNRLEHLVLPANLTTIYDGAFKNNKIGEVIFPDSVVRVDSDAFANNPVAKVRYNRFLKPMKYSVRPRRGIAEDAFDQKLPLVEIYNNGQIDNIFIKYHSDKNSDSSKIYTEVKIIDQKPITLTDPKTKVSLTYEAGLLPQGTRLVVEKYSDGHNEYQAWLAQVGLPTAVNHGLYLIKILDQEGIEVPIKSAVELIIPIEATERTAKISEAKNIRYLNYWFKADQNWVLGQTIGNTANEIRINTTRLGLFLVEEHGGQLAKLPKQIDYGYSDQLTPPKPIKPEEETQPSKTDQQELENGETENDDSFLPERPENTRKQKKMFENIVISEGQNIRQKLAVTGAGVSGQVLGYSILGLAFGCLISARQSKKRK